MFNGKIRTIDLDRVCERETSENITIAVDCVSSPRARTSVC